jgi:putative hydrolase of the HAD superfamily
MPPAFFYFDLGNVLLHFDHRLAARQMAEVAGLDVEQVWRLVFEGDLLRQVECGAITDRQFYDRFCEATGTRADYDRLQYAGSAIFTLNAPMVPLVGHLRDAGHRLGILSNTSESHWNFVSRGRYGLIPNAFEQVVLSYEAGAMKPDAVIYRLAAERAGVAPEQIFFTDDREENIAGAKEAGFDAVLYTDTRGLAQELRRRGARCNF